MPQDAYPVERLIVSIEGSPQRTGGDEADRISVAISFKNPIGSPGSTRRPPGMELRDETGAVYEPFNDDWAEALEPDTEMTSTVIFEVPPEAMAFEIVFAPGMPEEVRVPLDLPEAA